MHKRYVYKSIILHIAIVLLFTIDISFFGKKTIFEDTPPIIVDLENIEISDTTNLPEKAELGEENKVATRKETNNNEVSKNQQPKETVNDEIKEEPKAEEQIKAPSLIEEAPKFEEKTDTPSKESEKPQKEKKKPAPIPQRKPQIKPNKKQEPKPKKKPEPKKEPAKPVTAQPKPNQSKPVKSANPLAGFGSVMNDLKKQVAEKDALAQVKASDGVNNLGVEGGVAGGSYFSKLSISGKDFVKSKVQEKWKTIAGGKDDRNIEVVIIVRLTKEGIIQEIKIKDMARYRSDVYFQALADSAERAIHIAQSSDNVFGILAQQNPSSYSEWKEIIFTFTPLDGLR